MSGYDPWAPVYDAWASDMTEDVPYSVDLVREADGPVVELMVGSGRVAIPAARETGKPLLGIDSSPAMLAVARERAGDLPLTLRLGDVRDLELEEPAALVYVPYRSLLRLHGWHEKRRVFERVAAGLRPGGRFAFNAFAFDHRIAAAVDGATIRLWWATASEWEGLLDVSGLEVEARYGWFDKRPLEDDSPELVFVARKP